MAGAGAALVAPTHAGAASPLYLADMHFHLFFVGPKPANTQPLAANMAQGQATLVSWSLVGDQPWLAPTSGGFKQSGTPSLGQPSSWLKEEAARVQRHLADQKIALVRNAADVERARGGKPHVVLSVEGATFADDGIGQIKAAYDIGVRHLQLVHFITNTIGDMQTVSATHGGLTAFGKTIVPECNRLGILLDLAHCTDRAVEQALSISNAPMVWSHSSVQASRPLFPPIFNLWKARQLPLSLAKEIAGKGGVVGVWALGQDVGTSIDSYAERILELAERLGEDHVAFGTDMNALSKPAVRNFSDLRRVVTAMQRQGASDNRIRKIAFDNYARVLTKTLKA
jgi:membrane dipeptidase